MSKRVIVFGNSTLSSLNHFYLTYDSPHKVVAFTVDSAYMTGASFNGLPIVPFEDLESTYPPTEYELSILLGYRNVNQLRAQKYDQAKIKGYNLINYISSRAVIWQNVTLGDNCYIYENAILQPFASIGNDVILGPGSLIGHHSTIKDHCFIAARTTLLGCVTVEPYCVLGANATITDSTTVGRESIIGSSALINRDVEERSVYISSGAQLLPKPSNELRRVLTWSNDLKLRGT